MRAGRGHAGEPNLQDEANPATGTATAWMSAKTRREFATALGSIINAAKRITSGREPGREAAQEIIATAEALLLQSLVGNEERKSRPLSFIQSAPQSLPRAS
jgi:hypothetical protein